MSVHEPEKTFSIDAEYLSGRRFPYQEDLALVEDVDLLAATPGEDINWLEDIELLSEEGLPAVFDRYSNSFLKIYFPIPPGREHEIARKVLIKHLQSGNSYGIVLKERHCKFPQPELGPHLGASPPGRLGVDAIVEHKDLGYHAAGDAHRLAVGVEDPGRCQGHRPRTWRSDRAPRLQGAAGERQRVRRGSVAQ